MKRDILKKLTSRKLWLAVIGFAGAVAVAFGAPELSAEQTAIIAAGIASLASYIVGEGIADLANKK
jgi:H+/Cl- antiporter ClcA